MFDARYQVKFELELLAPLHVGTGEREVIPGVGGRDTNDKPEVTLIARDHENKPFLPSSSIKGLLRRICEETNKAFVDVLFGAIKKDDTGAMGAVLARGGTLVAAPPAAGAYPYGRTAAGDLGPGVFVAARTAVDPRAGTAADHRLYFQEMFSAATGSVTRWQRAGRPRRSRNGSTRSSAFSLISHGKKGSRSAGVRRTGTARYVCRGTA
jgi:hypothetical protein